MHEDKKHGKKTKGQLEISFNWIFILIAGGAILLFFIFVVSKETTSAEERTSYQVTKRMEALLSTVEQNPAALSDLKTFNIEFEFLCEDNAHIYGLTDSKITSELGSQIIFTPKYVGDANIYAWTRDFSSPYPITSILYLSDDRTKYIFHDQSTIAQSLYRAFPKELAVELMDGSTQIDEGFRKYIFVTDDNQPLSLPNSIKLKSTIVEIKSNTIDEGKIGFKGYRNIQGNIVEFGESAYATPEMIYGAIISGELDLYECTKRKLLLRTQFVDHMNSKRMQMIGNELSPLGPRGRCRLYYIGNQQSAAAQINAKISAIQDFENRFQDFTFHADKIRNLKDETRGASCPLIY